MKNMQALIAILVLVIVSISTVAVGQDRVDWLSGSQLDRQAQETAISLDWQSAPLRQRLQDLAKSQRISLFLDRRIDGSQKIKLSVINASFEQTLWKLCDQIGAGMCRIEDFYYIGPKEAAASLPYEVKQLKERIRQCENRTLKRRWQRKSPMNLPQLTEPKLAIERLLTSNRCDPNGLDSIPHDLWAEMQMGDSSLAARISLLLVGFDKTFITAEDLSGLEIVDWERPESVLREFSLGNQLKASLAMIAADFPNLEVKSTKRSILVESQFEQVLELHRKLVALQKPAVAELSDQKFDLTVADQRLRILESVAAQVGRELRFDEVHTMVLRGRIEMQLKQAGVNKIIEKTLEGTNLSFRFTDNTLELFEK